MNLQNELLVLDPKEFKFAVQMDSNNTPPLGTVPTLDIYLKPAKEGGFEPYQNKVPMQLEVLEIAPGLAKAPNSRRWLIFSLGQRSQAEVISLQALIKKRMADKGNGGGSLSVGITQESLALSDTTLARTRWESWLQTDKKTGFFELWSGTIAELKSQVRKNAN